MSNLPGSNLATPDPAFSTEAIAAVIVAIVTNAVILFELDLSDERQAALVTLLNTFVVVGYFVHGFLVRRKRAEVVAEQIRSNADNAFAAGQASAKES